jgi:hypothetical protein
MFDAIGHPVDELRRIAIGPLKDSRLKPGYWRDLTGEEVMQLKKVAARSTAPGPGHPDRALRPDHPDRPARSPVPRRAARRPARR